ncbi:hypothetical protein [Mycobacterium kubicae]|uniref:hypothetical protein n=1 Tax=Mycobacterium kubicae TaxID=120959 RepID=UPI000A92FAB8|nr:hypothetical protein [Mycobacterium kubicae]
MASIRTDGSTAYRVFFRRDGCQSLLAFDDPNVAETFRTAADQLGAARAMDLHRIQWQPRSQTTRTVATRVTDHIDHLSGVQPFTVATYWAYLRNDRPGAGCDTARPAHRPRRQPLDSEHDRLSQDHRQQAAISVLGPGGCGQSRPYNFESRCGRPPAPHGAP